MRYLIGFLRLGNYRLTNGQSDTSGRLIIISNKFPFPLIYRTHLNIERFHLSAPNRRRSSCLRGPSSSLNLSVFGMCDTITHSIGDLLPLHGTKHETEIHSIEFIWRAKHTQHTHSHTSKPSTKQWVKWNFQNSAIYHIYAIQITHERIATHHNNAQTLKRCM